MTDNVTPFHKKGAYTDFRVLVRDVMGNNPNIKRGILIIFDDKLGMKIDYVCTNSLLAFAGADLSYRSIIDDGK